MRLSILVLLASLGATSIATGQAKVADQAIADPATYLAEISSELKKSWPNNRTVVVICHGHSVPTGYFRTPEVRPFDAYPHLTHVEVRERYPTSVTSFICTGIGGENSEQGAKRFASDVLAKKPDVVTIDYSLNDRPIGLRRARVAWTRMIEQAKSTGVKVILLTPTADMRAKMSSPDDPLVKHAQQVRELAAEHHVGLADSFAAFQAYTAAGKPLQEIMSQGNHPNRAGHELVVSELVKWFPAPEDVE